MAPLLDAVLSVDAVRMYKPRREVYALVTARFALRPQEIVFVSSNRWDVMGAAAFGFRPLWVNRTRHARRICRVPATAERARFIDRWRRWNSKDLSVHRDRHRRGRLRHGDRRQ